MIVENIKGNFIVTECSETKWKACCNCIYFDNCIFKETNRIGIIPNLKEDFQEFIAELKRIKIKFLMELNRRFK